jgi:hypothetical protein
VACACASENKEKGREAGRCELLGRRLGRGKKKEREREGWGFRVFFQNLFKLIFKLLKL